MLFLLEVAVALDCYIDHCCCRLFLIDHNNVCLVSQHLLVCLELPQDLSSAILNHLWCLPFGLGDFQSVSRALCSCTLSQSLGHAFQCMLSLLAFYTLLLSARLTVSGASLYSLHLGSYLVGFTPASTNLVLSACSRAAMIRAFLLSALF